MSTEPEWLILQRQMTDALESIARSLEALAYEHGQSPPRWDRPVQSQADHEHMLSVLRQR